MRAVAKAAGTTTPTVYERYSDRENILRALRLKTRQELFATLSRTKTLRQGIQAQLKFAINNSHAYELLFDGVARPPSLHESWPSFNLMRERVAQRLGGNPRQYTRLMLAVWSLTHGTAMLIIRGEFSGALRTQTMHACLDAFDAIMKVAERANGLSVTGPKWPSHLVLGEGKRSSVGKRGRESEKAASAKKK